MLIGLFKNKNIFLLMSISLITLLPKLAIDFNIFSLRTKHTRYLFIYLLFMTEFKFALNLLIKNPE